MRRKSSSPTSWLLAAIAAGLLLVDAAQLAWAAEPAHGFELFMASLTLAAGAVLAAAAEPRLRR